MKNKNRICAYLNRHIIALVSGVHLRAYNLVMWYNEYSRDIYATSLDSYINGVINGYKIGKVDEKYNVIMCEDD